MKTYDPAEVLMTHFGYSKEELELLIVSGKSLGEEIDECQSWDEACIEKELTLCS
jgi:hypothetical protein